MEERERGEGRDAAERGRGAEASGWADQGGGGRSEARAKREPDFRRKGRASARRARPGGDRGAQPLTPPARARDRRALLWDVRGTQAFRTVTARARGWDGARGSGSSR